MEPFEILAEQAGLPTVPLPPELARVYGGDLGLAENSLYANFVATLDGVVAIPGLRNSNAVIADHSDADRFLMGLLRAVADAVLIGAGVLRASPKGTWGAGQIHPPAAASYGGAPRVARTSRGTRGCDPHGLGARSIPTIPCSRAVRWS